MTKATGSPQRLSRREFARRSLAAGAAISFPAIVTDRALGRSATVAAASERITLGVVGIGPRCTYDMSGILPQPDVQCVAISDVQKSRREAGKKLVDSHYKNQDCVLYRDFREMIDRKDIDACIVATGDRWHAPASMLCLQAGKDVYSEKPCGLTIGLCQDLDDTVRRYARVFQAGTQRRSVANFQLAAHLAHSGKLGKLHTLVASIYNLSNNFDWLPAESEPPKDEVDWDLWLGPAPWRPYNKAYVNGGWRGFYDFDSGARLLDWGAHTVDLCQWANQSDDTMPIEYEPGEKGITAHYANGVKLFIEFLATPFGNRPGWIQHLGTCPVRYIGDEGWVEVGDSGEIAVSPGPLEALVKDFQSKPVASGLDVSSHSRNFFDCIKSRALPAANSKVMRHSHIACHAAALSWMLNRKLKLDPVKEEFIGDEEANRLRTRAAREPWA